MVADKSLASMHPAAQRLLDYVEARLHPEQRLHAIALQLATGAGAQFERELFDYTFLLDRSLERQAQSPEVQKAFQTITAQSNQDRNVDYEITHAAMNDTLFKAWKGDAATADTLDDLTDWVLTYQTGGASTDQHPFERWQATKSTPWLLSALVTMRAGHPHAAEVERAAALIGPGSPAYDTALYHRVRLLEEKDKREQARKLLDANWPRIDKDSPSNRNAFLTQRFAVATSFQEFLHFAPRTLVEVNYGDYYCMNGTCRAKNSSVIEPPPELDLDSVEIFNQRLPLSMLVQAANGNTLPANLRDQLAARTWLRAAILNDTAAAHELEPRLLAKFPQVRSYIEQYDRADSPPARRFALVSMVMRFPGMQPFVNAMGMGEVISKGTSNAISSGSWWCYDVGGDGAQGISERILVRRIGSAVENEARSSPRAIMVEAGGKRSRRAGVAQAVGDWRRSDVFRSGSAGLGKDAFPTIPAFRKRCIISSVQPDTAVSTIRSAAYSREAFDWLHRKYPGSEWTKKTPYWYG